MYTIANYETEEVHIPINRIDEARYKYQLCFVVGGGGSSSYYSWSRIECEAKW